MRYFYKALFIALLLPVFSFAQSNYKPGYVVTLKGDTIRGLIDYKEWNSNPTSIEFKASATDKAREYDENQIRYFNIGGFDSYERYSGPISMDPTDKDHLSSTRDTSQREATVFFKVVQKGNNLTLYSYTDDLKSRFYVGEAPGYEPVPLVYRIYQQYGGGVENTYMKQLFSLANKYGVLDNGLQWDIEHAEYNTDNLLKIVSSINHISKAEYKTTNANKGPAFNLFVGAGVNINTTSSISNSSYSKAGGVSSTSLGPQASIGINIFTNPAIRRLQFRLEIGVSENHSKSLYESKAIPYIPLESSFDELQINFEPQVIYNFYNAENFKVYGDIGVNLTYFKCSNPYFGSQARPNSAAYLQDNEPYYFDSSDGALLVKVGVQIHKNWGVYAQYSSSIGLTNGGYFELSSTVKQVGINYFFW